MKAKKSLGQNFLKSKAAVAAMVAAGDISKNDTVVEIGPGRECSRRRFLNAPEECSPLKRRGSRRVSQRKIRDRN